MDDFKHISIADTAAMLATGQVVIADIRDEQSFLQGHIEGAVHLTNISMASFMSTVSFEQPVVVVCYHGNSSQGAARYLVQQGYDEVYSMDGGFEQWRASFSYVTADNE